jgi:hypothetical protein
MRARRRLDAIAVGKSGTIVGPRPLGVLAGSEHGREDLIGPSKTPLFISLAGFAPDDDLKRPHHFTL